ncbi:hypothetical protein Pelo_2269 [Pelomyxa schiedti]|nr:hypothetical protein Pelo_2269 [Pelomyxa schiedti]
MASTRPRLTFFTRSCCFNVKPLAVFLLVVTLFLLARTASSTLYTVEEPRRGIAAHRERLAAKLNYGKPTCDAPYSAAAPATQFATALGHHALFVAHTGCSCTKPAPLGTRVGRDGGGGGVIAAGATAGECAGVDPVCGCCNCNDACNCSAVPHTDLLVTTLIGYTVLYTKLWDDFITTSIVVMASMNDTVPPCALSVGPRGVHVTCTGDLDYTSPKENCVSGVGFHSTLEYFTSFLLCSSSASTTPNGIYVCNGTLGSQLDPLTLDCPSVIPVSGIEVLYQMPLYGTIGGNIPSHPSPVVLMAVGDQKVVVVWNDDTITGYGWNQLAIYQTLSAHVECSSACLGSWMVMLALRDTTGNLTFTLAKFVGESFPDGGQWIIKDVYSMYNVNLTSCQLVCGDILYFSTNFSPLAFLSLTTNMLMAMGMKTFCLDPGIMESLSLNSFLLEIGISTGLTLRFLTVKLLLASLFQHGNPSRDFSI